MAALGLLPLLGVQAQQRPATSLTPATTLAPRLQHPEILGGPGAVSRPAMPAVRPQAQHRTTAAIASTATGGNWSSPSTWVGGAVPSATDDVTIVSGATVTLDVAAVAGSLTINTGGTLTTSATTAYSLQVGGNVTNNGTLTMSASPTLGSDLRFVGAGNVTFGGTGTTDLYTMSLAKAALADVVDMNLPTLSVRGTAASTTGFLLTRTTATPAADDMTGTLKISGTATITNRVFGNAAAYILPATGAFWLNNANFTVSAQTGSPTVNGQLRLTAGAFNVGTSIGNSILFGTGSTLTVEGGTMSSAGRIGNFTGAAAVGGAMTFVQSGGTINVSTIGNTSGTPSFGIAGNVTMTGGTVNLVQRSTATTPLDYYVAQFAATNTLNLNGGTVVAGTGATATNFDFRLRGNVPNLTIDNTTNPKTVQLANALYVYGTATIQPTTTLILNAFTLFEFGPAIVNNGTLNGSAAATTSSTLYFAGTTGQTLGGTGTFTAPLKSLSLDNSGAGVTLTAPLTVGRVNFFTGPLLGANRLTIGDGTAVFNFVQYGATGITYAAGTFDAAPTFNIGSGALSLIYSAEAARTTGFEIPTNRTVDAVSIANANGVTLAGGNLTINASGVSTGSLTLTSGILTVPAANKVTIGKAATTLPTGSATSYVRGSLGMTVNSATAVSRTFAVGDVAWRPVVVGGITNTADQVYTATVINGATGGNGPLLTLNPTRYVRLENTANLPATATVQLSYGADDTGIDATSLVAQAATANGTYAPIGGAAATVPTTGIVSTQNLTPGNDFFVLAAPQACNATFSYASTSYCTTGTNPTPTTPASTGGTFTSTTGLSLNATTGAINLSASTPGTYVVAYNVGATCSGSATVTITAPATAGFSYATASYCTSATTAVAPTLATGATAGSFTSTTGLTLNATTGAITPSTSTPGTYTVTNPVAAGGCAAATSTATVTITAPATAGFSYAAASYCTSATAAVPATLATGATAGSFTSTSGLTLNAATGAITPSTSTPGTYTVTNTVAAAGGCAAVTSNAQVTITAPATAGFSYATASYCTSATAAVAPTLATGATAGAFTSTTGLTLNATTGAITPSTSTPGTYTVTNTVAAAGGCAAATSTATVTIVAPATAGFSYATTGSSCAASTGTLAATLATGATAGTFSSTTGLSLNATTGAIDLAASTAGTYTVTNTLAASGGCAAVTSTATVTLNARPAQPTVTVAYPPTPGTAVLTASAAPAGGSYQWFVGPTAITGATGQTYTASGNTQPGAYTVVITSAQGCASPASTPLTVTSTLKPLAGSSLSVYPNPSHDGRLTLELTGYSKAARLTVLNALGQVVREQAVAAGQTKATLDLTTQPAGVYLLRVSTDGGTDLRRIVRE